MFKAIRSFFKDPLPKTIDLRLDKSTEKQKEALSALQDWIDQLTQQHGFQLEIDNGYSQFVTLTRNERKPLHLRARVETLLYVEEDDKEQRKLDTKHSEINLFCYALVDEETDREIEVDFNSRFTIRNIEKARAKLDTFLVTFNDASRALTIEDF